jgi:CheY-like chemotaxis protein
MSLFRTRTDRILKGLGSSNPLLSAIESLRTDSRSGAISCRNRDAERQTLRRGPRFNDHSDVIDIGLPDIDGYELARKLREIPETRVRAMLVEIYRWFTEGFDTGDLKDAKTLLDELNG